MQKHREKKYIAIEIDQLERVQKFALRVCLTSWDTDYEDLLSISNLPSLQKHCMLTSLCHLFKISRGFKLLTFMTHRSNSIHIATTPAQHVNRCFPCCSVELTHIRAPIFQIPSQIGIAFLVRLPNVHLSKLLKSMSFHFYNTITLI